MKKFILLIALVLCIGGASIVSSADAASAKWYSCSGEHSWYSWLGIKIAHESFASAYKVNASATAVIDKNTANGNIESYIFWSHNQESYSWVFANDNDGVQGSTKAHFTLGISYDDNSIGVQQFSGWTDVIGLLDGHNTTLYGDTL